jgi:hypothetical protein
MPYGMWAYIRLSDCNTCHLSQYVTSASSPSPMAIQPYLGFGVLYHPPPSISNLRQPSPILEFEHTLSILSYMTSVLSYFRLPYISPPIANRVPYFILSHVQSLIQYYLPSHLSCYFISLPISHVILSPVLSLMLSCFSSHLSCNIISRPISHAILSPVPSLMQFYLPSYLSYNFISLLISHVYLSPILSLRLSCLSSHLLCNLIFRPISHAILSPVPSVM